MELLVARWAPGGFSQRTITLVLNLRSELGLAFVVGLAVLVLRFALLNHRSAERGGRRVLRQGAMLCAAVLVSQFIFTSLGALYAVGLRPLRAGGAQTLFLSPWRGGPAGGTSSTS